MLGLTPCTTALTITDEINWAGMPGFDRNRAHLYAQATKYARPVSIRAWQPGMYRSAARAVDYIMDAHIRGYNSTITVILYVL